MIDEDAQRALSKAKRDARLREIQRNEVLRSLMSTTSGRAWVYDKLAACGVGQTPFSADPYATAFNCGRQNIGLMFLDEVMTAAPNEYILMMKENTSHGPADELRNPDGSDNTDDGDRINHDSGEA